MDISYTSDSSDIQRQPMNIQSFGRESKPGHTRRKKRADNLNTLQMHTIFNDQYAAETNKTGRHDKLDYFKEPSRY